ncbi:hypothetical protein [Nocardioides sp. 1609]|uniref:hypothetical protein n=1 Tax=Nocardioides sp. 1609 TaxID=2508327 RepID=UPI00106F5823|nr:hypothetical protein [Nocardioides sp. 1609]
MDISPRLARWITRELVAADAEHVLRELGDLSDSVLGGQDRERIQAALVIRSGGERARFDGMLRLAREDWRDLLVAADLGHGDWRNVLDDVLGPAGGSA